MELIIKEKCEGCEDSGLQIQDEGPLRGMTRPCPVCAGNYKNYANKYGTDAEENPLVFIDNSGETPMIKKITHKDINRKYIIMPNGEEKELIL